MLLDVLDVDELDWGLPLDAHVDHSFHPCFDFGLQLLVTSLGDLQMPGNELGMEKCSETVFRDEKDLGELCRPSGARKRVRDEGVEGRKTST